LLGRKTIQVYGPVGIYNYIASTLSLSCTELNRLRVEVYELHGGSPRWRHPGGSRTYPEFRHRGLVRKVIPQNPDGTWTLLTVSEITSPEQAESYTAHFKGVYVTAAEVEHTPKVRCFGYVVQEAKTQAAKIDKERAIALGLKPSTKYRILKCGFPVMSDDGTREIQPEEVLVGDAVRPRKFALLGDCCNVPTPMTKLCQDADVLVHEATLSENDTGHKVESGGHSSAAKAGKFANEVNANVLALVHLPPTVRSNSSIKALVQEAQKGVRGRTRVQLTCDLMELLVPRSGFQLPGRAMEMKYSEADEKPKEMGSSIDKL
jgi:ribonuclease Z